MPFMSLDVLPVHERPVGEQPDESPVGEPPFFVAILGRQGSGKGTQSSLLTAKYGCVHVSTGDMLREAVVSGTSLGRKAEAVMHAGQLVSDEIIVKIVEERLVREDVLAYGALLDGFPRTIKQAEALEAILERMSRHLAVVINIEVPAEIVTRRMLLRARSDDSLQAITRRLDIYEHEIAPVVEWFSERQVLVGIDGTGTVEDVFQKVTETIKLYCHKT